jgi:hemerythrin
MTQPRQSSIEPAPEVTLVSRVADGRILEASTAATSMYGYTHGELLERTIFDLRTEANRATAAAQMAVAEVRPVRFETTHQRKDGSHLRVQVSARGAMSDGCWVLLSTIRPVPDQAPSGAAAARPGRPAEEAPPGCDHRTAVWTPELSIGIELIDGQHRLICSAVAELRDAMKSNQLARLPGVARALRRYAAEHFLTEEGEMERARYPGLAEHRAAHTAFAAQMEEHLSSLAHSPAPSAVLDLSSWLTHWVREHIRQVDAEMGRFLRARSGAAGR